MNLGEIIEKSVHEQNSGLIDVPGEVREAIERVVNDVYEGRSQGRASEDILKDLSDYVNVIPARHYGACSYILITICYDKDNFENRILESLDHSTKTCPDMCEYIYLLTTQWNSATVNKLSGYIEAVRKNGVKIRMVYITDKGIAVMPV